MHRPRFLPPAHFSLRPETYKDEDMNWLCRGSVNLRKASLAYHTLHLRTLLPSRAMSNSTKPSWNAELYAQARPDYPDSIISAILEAPSSNSPLNIVDLGAGTGICSKLLIQACSKSAPGNHELASIISLDAAPNMLKELSKSLYEPGGFVSSLQGKGQLSHNIKTGTGVAKFEDIELSRQGLQGKVDLITIAQVRCRLDKVYEVLGQH